jgi:serine/threonine protein kinase
VIVTSRNQLSKTSMLQGVQPLPTLSDLLDIGEDIARGMAAIHGEKIVFRGLKPAKLLVDHEGRVRIVGFGDAQYQTGSS